MKEKGKKNKGETKLPKSIPVSVFCRLQGYSGRDLEVILKKFSNIENKTSVVWEKVVNEFLKK